MATAPFWHHCNWCKVEGHPKPSTHPEPQDLEIFMVQIPTWRPVDTTRCKASETAPSWNAKSWQITIYICIYAYIIIYVCIYIYHSCIYIILYLCSHIVCIDTCVICIHISICLYEYKWSPNTPGRASSHCHLSEPSSLPDFQTSSVWDQRTPCGFGPENGVPC